MTMEDGGGVMTCHSDTVTACLVFSFYPELAGHQHTLTDWLTGRRRKKQQIETVLLLEDYFYISHFSPHTRWDPHCEELI